MTNEISSSADPSAPNTPGAAAQYYYNLSKNNTQSNLVKSLPEFEDPDPPKENATNEDILNYKTEVNAYSNEMYDIFIENNYKGESLWIEFTATFRPQTIPNLSRNNISKWTTLLQNGGVYISRERKVTRTSALVQCLERDVFVPCPSTLETGDKNTYEKTSSKTPKQIPLFNTNKNGETPNNDTGTNEYTSDNSYKQSNTSSEKEDKSESKTADFSLGINGLMKAYQGRKKYSGDFNDDLTSAFQLYETLCNMCHLRDNERSEVLPVMLCGEALNRFTSLNAHNLSYIELKEKLLSHFISEEQKGRMLTMWQSMRLSDAMRAEPDKSELEIFRQFSYKLSQIQQQLDTPYRHDNFLRDQLMISVDIPNIQQLLKERVPRTSQQAINRVATFLSSEPTSAGSYITKSNESRTAMYTLGQKFGGNNNYNNNKHKNWKTNRNKVSSNWIRGVKGCFVCGQNHKARSRHPAHEVRAAIEKLKQNNPTALISVEDLAFISEELAQDNSEDKNEIEFSDDEDNESQSEAYIVEDALDMHKQTEAKLANMSFLHGRSYEKDQLNAYTVMERELKLGETTMFKGILLDTCCNRSSVMSLSQYKAYCEEFNVPTKLKPDTKSISGIGGNSKAVGTAMIPIPFTDLNLVIDVEFTIMKDNVPTLLSMKDMKDNGLDLSIQKEELYYKHLTQQLSMENYFLIHRWGKGDIAYSLYTESELRKLHRVFGHPTVSALFKLLQQARGSEIDKSVRETLEEISKSCITCAVNATKPRRFKLTVGTDDLRFNHIVAMDVMYLNGRPVLHVVDEATHFGAALFLKNQSTKSIWKAFLKCWTRIYLGPPDFLQVDQGTNFISSEFGECAKAEGITVLKAPIESANTMSHVERYHAPLRSAYKKIRDSLPRSETDDECLQLAVKAVNDTIGPEGLIPTLLVFGAIPRPATTEQSKCQMERAKALDLAMDSVRKEQAKRRINFGLQTKGPKAMEHSEKLRNLPAGSPVYVYRQKSNKWEGPFLFIEIQGETVTVQQPSGRKIFRSTVVKPCVESKLQNMDTQQLKHTRDVVYDKLSQALFSTPESNQSSEMDFSISRKTEWKGLLESLTFEIVKISTVRKGTRIYNCRFVDSFKLKDGKLVPKSRLVAMNYNDHEAKNISTKSPTITKLSQRIAISLAACYPELKPYLRDIIQAFIQALSTLERDVYLKPLPEMNLADDEVLLVRKPLYGVPESGLHWFVSYQGHHKDKIGMKATIVDPCLLYRSDGKHLEGITILQVDDSFGFGTDDFLSDEDSCGKYFKSKPRVFLEKGKEIVFNGSEIRRNEDGTFTLHQKKKLESLTHVTSDEEFSSMRAAVQYIGYSSRPDICSSAQLLATNTPTSSDKKKLNNLIDYCRSTSQQGLNFIKLDLESCRLALFTDSSFANGSNFKSQLGFIILLVDKFNNCNILHYGSNRCKRVTRSVMAAEIHALIYGFDSAYITKSMMEEILNREIDIEAYVDSRTTFNVIARSAPTLEKRLQIDVFGIRESHEKGELKRLGCLPGTQNYSDGLTKDSITTNHCLWDLMNTNKMKVTAEIWVQKD